MISRIRRRILSLIPGGNSTASAPRSSPGACTRETASTCHSTTTRWVGGADAQAGGYTVNSTPQVGAVAWWDTGKVATSHVAWVESVNGSTVTVEEYNAKVAYGYDERVLSSPPTDYIHFKDISGGSGGGPSAYINHIVQWNGDTKPQKTAWLVGPDLHRRWIPDISTYNCLKSRGFVGPDVLSSSTLNQLPGPERRLGCLRRRPDRDEQHASARRGCPFLERLVPP